MGIEKGKRQKWRGILFPVPLFSVLFSSEHSSLSDIFTYIFLKLFEASIPTLPNKIQTPLPIIFTFMSSVLRTLLGTVLSSTHISFLHNVKIFRSHILKETVNNFSNIFYFIHIKIL